MSTAERSAHARDIAHMRRALSLSLEGWGRTAPNPLVGAVIVRDDVVVGEGYHAEYGAPHAEVMALRQAGENARGATIYVSLEPCAHHGKTPPCTEALIAAGLSRVVVATADPNPVARGGAAALRAAGIVVEMGVEGAAACELNAAFLHAFRATRPWMTLKLAVSADGAIADATRAQRWLTGPLGREEVHRLRAGHDAIAVGLGTVLADDPSLTARGPVRPRVAPSRIVFDDDALLPRGSVLARTARETPTIVLARRPESSRVAALRELGVDVIAAETTEQALETLARRGIRSVLVEGGARVAGRLLDRALVDRMIIFQAPMVLGPGSLDAFAHAPGMSFDHLAQLPVVMTRAIGDDTMTIYAIQPSPCSPD
jgi:diaminohydroxyphosphoribosylaminopyrimidine deaminase/5-amino-6-(5-phosphoribosylamino)uracil reductase